MSAVRHSEFFEVSQPVAELFPLFSAEGEKLWVPGWDYERVSEGTSLHEDYVFLTKGHDHAASNAIWVVKRFDPQEYFVQFYKIEPEEKIGIISIKCFELAESRARVQVSYEYLGLSPSGNAFVEGFSLASYKEFIAEWESLLLRYFAKER